MQVEFIIAITVRTATGKQRFQAGDIVDNDVVQIHNLEAYIASGFIREVT